MRKFYFFLATLFAGACLSTAHAQKEGDVITIDDVPYQLGPNLITNGSFNDGVNNWEAGNGSALGSTFTIVETGGANDDGPFLNPTGHTGAAGASSIGTGWAIEPGKQYYFAFSIKSLKGFTGTNEFLVTSLGMSLRDESEAFKLMGNGNNNPEGASLAGNAQMTEDGSWTKNEVVFTNSDNYTFVNCRFRWLGEGDAAGNYGFDEFYLGEITTVNPDDAVTVKLRELDNFRTTIENYVNSDEMQEYKGLAEELYTAYELTWDADESTVEGMDAEIARLKAAQNKAKAGLALVKELQAIYDDCSNNLLINTAYPGYDEFSIACDEANDVLISPESMKYADYEAAIANLEEARATYLYSQVGTIDTPADYSFLIQYPDFYDPACGISKDLITADNRSEWDQFEPWVYETVKVNGGDYRTNYVGGKPCWNSWNDNFTSMDVHQDLTGLPNGLYSLECKAMTQEGLISNQHAYISGTAGTAVSPAMTIDNGWNLPEGWETLQTATINVIDGNLRIGFASTSNGGKTGWFCVTEFKLYYHGASETDMKSVLNNRIAEANALVSNLKGDRVALQGALNIAANANTDEEILAALDTINTAYAAVEASNAAYNVFVEGALATAKTNAETLGENGKTILKYAIAQVEAYLASETATAAEMNSTYKDALTNYQSYTTALANTEIEMSAPPVGYMESTLIDLENTMDLHKQGLTSSLASQTTIDACIAQLNNGIQSIKASVYVQEAKTYGAGYDISGMIMNADAAAKDGWTWLNLEDGPIKSGQYYNPEECIYDEATGTYTETNTHSYFDSWRSTAGALKLTGYQELNYLPNGNYTLKVAARSACDQGGALLFVVAKGNEAIAQNDTIWKPIISNHDVAGSIWEEAKAADPLSPMALTNSGQGRGWNWHEITFDVVDHKASIGFSTDSTLTHVRFTGTWFSAVDFTLIMNSYADSNDENFGWITGVEAGATIDNDLLVRTNGRKIVVLNANDQEVEVYTATGMRVNAEAEQPAGIYLVKVGKKVAKVAIK